ncbi:hypothetical protein LshimejAT787_0102770 [Lyophyllum shimeji]|uniref:Uncharacterized protein n=1 Tax=Lyophyllum shimeji TaxID=47721 RepID=A0A9P3PDE4_LYOSH|nr:hypothetical protein LshimejAT787_0102770 [Lyophyllum shimeji]
MSISVDELAASLSSSHIGQEALDLAALQAQLAQTLFGQSIAHSSDARQVSRKTSYTQPCNTPTFSSLSQLDAQHGQTTASKPNWSFDGSSFDRRDDVDEDERMVEDLLIPCSPMSATSSALQFSLPGSKSHFISNSQTSETSSSSFTSTDPFYIAQSQAQYPSPSPQSTFTQLGQLPQQSPFTFPQRRDHLETSHSTAPLSLETHTFLVAASAAFDH